MAALFGYIHLKHPVQNPCKFGLYAFQESCSAHLPFGSWKAVLMVPGVYDGTWHKAKPDSGWCGEPGCEWGARTGYDQKWGSGVLCQPGQDAGSCPHQEGHPTPFGLRLFFLK